MLGTANEESIEYQNAFHVKGRVENIKDVTYHWHDEYELIGVLSGDLLIHILDETVHLKEGEMYLVNTGQIHSLVCENSYSALCMIFQFSPSLLPETVENCTVWFTLYSQSDEAPECGYPFLYYKLAKVISRYMDPECSALRRYAEAIGLISDLHEYAIYDLHYRLAGQESAQTDVLRIHAFLRAHIAEADILDQACHEMGMSRKTLDRVLKTGLGKTGKELLDELRIEKARSLLRNTDYSMGFIMDACGFQSEKTFYRAFRNAVGMTPQDFRRNDALQDAGMNIGYLDYEIPHAWDMVQNILESYEGQ